jgi:hypothetical protein
MGRKKLWRLCHIQAVASSHTLPDVKLTSRATYPEDKRESDAIASVSGTAPKDSKESERKPPLKDHETWSKEKRLASMLENFKLSTSPVLNTPQKVDRAVEFLDKYWDLYSIDGSFGKTNLLEHRIYTEKAKPWTDIVGKDENREIEKAPIVATPSMVGNYCHLKQALLTSPVLAYPQFDSKEPFILDTDWSGDANTIRGVL